MNFIYIVKIKSFQNFSRNNYSVEENIYITYLS